MKIIVANVAPMSPHPVVVNWIEEASTVYKKYNNYNIKEQAISRHSIWTLCKGNHFLVGKLSYSTKQKHFA